MKKLIVYLISLSILLLISCDNDDTPETQNSGIEKITCGPSYTVLTSNDITYAEGLSRTSSTSTPIPLKLDIYYPDNNFTDRSVFMFIHGGGFKGGTKTKPEIVEMANYYASRGWVFASIDYRTTEELGSIKNLSQNDLYTFYKGIAPQEWIKNTFDGAENTEQVQQSIAMYTTQRDSKAALRWIVANANTYKINTDLITVGGASAGAITTIALGISDEKDFRDEISTNDDPTLLSTNLDQTYDVKSMVYFWGSNIKLDVFEGVYELNRYDNEDPELFMAHGNQHDPVTPYEEAIELQGIYDSLKIYNKLYTLEGFGHGAWNATVNGKGLSELSFEFLIDRQNLIVE